MSATSSSDIGSFKPTSPRSCASDNGSGVAARNRAHCARLNPMNLETSTTELSDTGYILQPEHQRERHRESNDDDDAADGGAADATGEMCAADAADHRSCGQEESVRPVDQTGKRKVDRRDDVDAGRQQVLEPVHLVHVGVPH